MTSGEFDLSTSNRWLASAPSVFTNTVKLKTRNNRRMILRFSNGGSTCDRQLAWARVDYGGVEWQERDIGLDEKWKRKVVGAVNSFI